MLTATPDACLDRNGMIEIYLPVLSGRKKASPWVGQWSEGALVEASSLTSSAMQDLHNGLCHDPFGEVLQATHCFLGGGKASLDFSFDF